MSLIVQKFGGTSVATSEHIKRVAARIATTRGAGHQVVAVVSAMGSMTDELAALAARVSPRPPAREMDMLLTAGERISMALLAMALDVEGVGAVSLTGSQAGILTMGAHGSARIHEVRSFRVQEGLDQGKVVIVAGFQGVDPESKDVTTLGRGGSDVTALALAAAHGAEVCEIYKDVDGVFTADPRLVPAARLLPEVSYQEMKGLAAGGSQVLMGKAVEIAEMSGVPVHVRSSFHDREGTWVRATAGGGRLCGIAHDEDVVWVTLLAVEAAASEKLLSALAEAGFAPEIVHRSPVGPDRFDVSFATGESSIAWALDLIADAGVEAETERGFGTVSLVGESVSADGDWGTERTLSGAGIPVRAWSVAPHRIACLISRPQLPDAIRALHETLLVGTS